MLRNIFFSPEHNHALLQKSSGFHNVQLRSSFNKASLKNAFVNDLLDDNA